MSLPTPFFRDAFVTLYCGDALEIVKHLEPESFSAVVTDPPYNETSLEWDRWPTGWPSAVAHLSNSLWCFGSMRMFLEKRGEFAGWNFSQDIVWEKHNGSSLHADRFKRVHECAAHFYRGKWADVFKAPVFTNDATARSLRRKVKPDHFGAVKGTAVYKSEDGGPRMERSVIFCRSCHGHAIHPTQKPEGIMRPLIQYSVPAGGLVLDPFAGSGTTLLVAKQEGRRSVGIERSPEYCKAIVDRLGQGVMTL